MFELFVFLAQSYVTYFFHQDVPQKELPHSSYIVQVNVNYFEDLRLFWIAHALFKLLIPTFLN